MKAWNTFAVKVWTEYPYHLYIETWGGEPSIQVGDQINQKLESGRTGMFTVTRAKRMSGGGDLIGSRPWSVTVEPFGYMEAP